MEELALLSRGQASGHALPQDEPLRLVLHVSVKGEPREIHAPGLGHAPLVERRAEAGSQAVASEVQPPGLVSCRPSPAVGQLEQGVGERPHGGEGPSVLAEAERVLEPGHERLGRGTGRFSERRAERARDQRARLLEGSGFEQAGRGSGRFAPHKSALERAMAGAKVAGAKRALPLQVSIAAHSPLMDSIQAEWNAAVGACLIENPGIPVIGNVHANVLLTADELRADIKAQMQSRVRWTESVGTMLGSGIQAYVEVGNGEVLLGMVKRIDSSASRFPLGNSKDFDALQ